MKRVLPLLLLLAAWPAGRLAAQSLEAADAARLDRYLAQLKASQPGAAESVDQLADISFAGLRQAMEAYVALDEPVEPHTHRAFQALLERTSRMALAPWPMVEMYSPQFVRFLTAPPSENRLAERLFQRLMGSGPERRAFDLAVRLTPDATLRRLASGKLPGRVSLLEAWHRRLSRSAERRPLAELGPLVRAISQSFALDRTAAEIEALLRFMAGWPAEQATYAANLTSCLQSADPKIVLAALAAQQRVPARLDLNAALLARFPDEPSIVQAALKNYAFDTAHDHSAVLRRLWAMLKPDDERGRYNCLFSMGAHPAGNDDIALAAVLERPYAFIDVAMPVLAHGDRMRAAQAIRHVLTSSKRGQEEPFRLASELQLAGFETEALQAALDKGRDQILRQSAMQYLRPADGRIRRQLAGLLTDSGSDLRLSAIQVFADKRGLSQQDRDEIGPALIRVAQDDPSMGHRQEAIYTLGSWREELAREFFGTILAANPPLLMTRGNQGDEQYWRYRFRLVALLGLAKLKDQPARDELLDLHRRGGPLERMDVLLAFRDLGEMPAVALGDLEASEPKLVATAAQLIALHGDSAAHERLRRFFRRTPVWLEFKDSGIDDHNLLRAAGLDDAGAEHHDAGSEKHVEAR